MDIQEVDRNFRDTGILRPLDGLTQEVKWREYAEGGGGLDFSSFFTRGRDMGGGSGDEEKDTSKEVEKGGPRKTLYSGEEKRQRELREGKEKTALALVPQATIFEYYCNVVPTTYQGIADTRHVYQFTVNSNRITNTHMPGIYLRYGMSPVTVKYSDFRMPFFTFMIQTLAIVGGLFTVAGLLEAVLHKGIQSVSKKIELGKFT